MLVRKSKDNHSIPLGIWDIYLKKLYESLDTMENIISTPIKHDIFSLQDNESHINKLTNGKFKAIEGYQVDI